MPVLRQIPNPYGTPWQTWCDTLIGYNGILISNISPDEPWEVVAERLTQYATDAPLPDTFDTWQEWAAALKQVYPS